MTILWYSNDGHRWEYVTARDQGEYLNLIESLCGTFPYVRITKHVMDIGRRGDRDAGPRVGVRPDQAALVGSAADKGVDDGR